MSKGAFASFPGKGLGVDQSHCKICSVLWGVSFSILLTLNLCASFRALIIMVQHFVCSSCRHMFSIV